MGSLSVGHLAPLEAARIQAVPFVAGFYKIATPCAIKLPLKALSTH